MLLAYCYRSPVRPWAPLGPRRHSVFCMCIFYVRTHLNSFDLGNVAFQEVFCVIELLLHVGKLLENLRIENFLFSGISKMNDKQIHQEGTEHLYKSVLRCPNISKKDKDIQTKYQATAGPLRPARRKIYFEHVDIFPIYCWYTVGIFLVYSLYIFCTCFVYVWHIFWTI